MVTSWNYASEEYKARLQHEQAPPEWNWQLNLHTLGYLLPTMTVAHLHHPFITEQVNGQRVPVPAPCSGCPRQSVAYLQCVCAPTRYLCDACFLWHVTAGEKREDFLRSLRFGLM